MDMYVRDHKDHVVMARTDGRHMHLQPIKCEMRAFYIPSNVYLLLSLQMSSLNLIGKFFFYDINNVKFNSVI